MENGNGFPSMEKFQRKVTKYLLNNHQMDYKQRVVQLHFLSITI